MLSGDVPCSQAQRTHSCTAIGWLSMELVSKLFDTPSYVNETAELTGTEASAITKINLTTVIISVAVLCVHDKLFEIF